MYDNQRGLPAEAVAAILSIILIAWGISWLIGLITT